jgi:hypothetical protein
MRSELERDNFNPMKKITAIKVLENYRVRLRFDDGVEGELDFSQIPRTGVYARWQNYEHFRLARIGEYGELVWDEQLDFCPDSLWLQVTGRAAEELHPNTTNLASSHA